MSDAYYCKECTIQEKDVSYLLSLSLIKGVEKPSHHSMLLYAMFPINYTESFNIVLLQHIPFLINVV